MDKVWYCEICRQTVRLRSDGSPSFLPWRLDLHDLAMPKNFTSPKVELTDFIYKQAVS
jgi:hypothetical protein